MQAMSHLPELSWKELNCFKERQVPLGRMNFWYERSLFRAGNEFWALVREAGKRNDRLVLNRYFELVAQSIDLEMALKLGAHHPLRFFHLHYVDKKMDGPVWAIKEVLIHPLRGEAVWAPIDRQVEQALIAAWHSASKSPNRHP